MGSLTKTSQLILSNSGWSFDRKIDPTNWLTLIENSGYPIFDALVQCLQKFGGLQIITQPFREEPFLLEDKQRAILMYRKDPILDFLPDKSDAVEDDQAAIWRSLHCLEIDQQQIAPIGNYRFMYNENSLFILSNGSIYGGVYEAIGTEREIIGLFYLGRSIEDTINNTITQSLAFF